ncbi:MAG: hypothetical protein BJ554DRAFT_4199, partial [Olpidium bornovanus]
AGAPFVLFVRVFTFILSIDLYFLLLKSAGQVPPVFQALSPLVMNFVAVIQLVTVSSCVESFPSPSYSRSPDCCCFCCFHPYSHFPLFLFCYAHHPRGVGGNPLLPLLSFSLMRSLRWKSRVVSLSLPLLPLPHLMVDFPIIGLLLFLLSSPLFSFSVCFCFVMHTIPGGWGVVPSFLCFSSA